MACHPTPANSKCVQSRSLLQQSSVRALRGWYGSAQNSATAGRMRHRAESREQPAFSTGFQPRASTHHTVGE